MLTSNFRLVKSSASRNFTFACRVFSTGTTKNPATVSHRSTPKSLPQSVFRRLSAPFKSTLPPNLVSYREFRRLLPSRTALPRPKHLKKKISILKVTVASPSPPASGAVPKRKRVTGEMKYYAVRKGYNPGIYTTWKECLGQVTGFKGATCKCYSLLLDVCEKKMGGGPG
ncbi:hypothetical protein L211DRAFT_781480 [Terfezia boudieri ATCC MYA-4762]|uniref:Ribonuclease H1 N-terminal domain-containing protein n=1 Tax=Terfezia boudieri ATCC MYA-4762 TaxID=1051890 RepID=A0A3N4LZ39_9PEZI|nr:hypothetical protein L211DRAFT_781480 [Terfezia boudieri ATCC MYA-4762]